jgi:phage terminase large subunit-like protein
LVAAIRKAQRLPAEEPKTRNLFLNQRVSPVSPLINRVVWQECIGDAELIEGEEVYAALDLSSVDDLTALIVGSASDPCRIAAFFWKPIEWLAEHAARDFGSGSHRYEEWVATGHLLTTPGKAINHESIALCIADLTQRFRVRGLAYDRWRMQFLLNEFDRIGLQAHEDASHPENNGPQRMIPPRSKGDGLRIIPWGQGFKDMGPAVDALMKALDENKLLHSNNPVLNWNVANAVAVMDPSGFRKLDKSKVRFRIDGAVALAMLMGLRARDRTAKPIDIETLIG